MLKTAIIAISMFVSTTVFAGPFGLTMGMKQEEVKGDLLSEEEKGRMYFYKALDGVTTNAEGFALKFVPGYGLSEIIKVSENINTAPNGKHFKDEFDEIVGIIDERYGKHKEDHYMFGIYKSSMYEMDMFMYALHRGQASMAVVWFPENDPEIAAILVEGKATKSVDYGSIVITYQSKAESDYIKVLNAEMKSVY